MRRLVIVLLLLVACVACQEKANEGRRMPKAPPVPNAALDPKIDIVVTIDGQLGEAITAARLDKTPATYAEEGKRAWRLDLLFGAKGAREGVSYTVTGEGGMAIVLKPPTQIGAPVPVIAANLRGEVIVAMVSPQEPFPAYHGQGGRLGRRGDPLPRIANVTAISVGVGPVVPGPATQPTSAPTR